MAKLQYDKTGRLLFTKEMKKEYTILFPMMAPIHFNIIKDVFTHYGYKAVLLETTGPQIAPVSYTHLDVYKRQDLTYEDTTLGEKSWEKAESRLQKEAVNCAMKKAGVTAGAVDYIFAGDLLNQCISSTFGLRSLGIPFLGQYGACSTMAQTLAMSSFLVDGGMANLCVAVTSSHFCSAERQFRFPLEYGGQRTCLLYTSRCV